MRRLLVYPYFNALIFQLTLGSTFYQLPSKMTIQTIQRPKKEKALMIPKNACYNANFVSPPRRQRKLPRNANPLGRSLV